MIIYLSYCRMQSVHPVPGNVYTIVRFQPNMRYLGVGMGAGHNFVNILTGVPFTIPNYDYQNYRFFTGYIDDSREGNGEQEPHQEDPMLPPPPPPGTAAAGGSRRKTRRRRRRQSR